MRIQSKYRGIKGFVRVYNYAIKHNYMITKTAQKRYDILLFWRTHGLPATTAAFGAKRSILYAWNKIYKESDYKIESLNPGTQARKFNNKMKIHHLLLAEIKRLRLEVCPNMGKAKIKIFLDKFSAKNNLPVYSESKIGRIIKLKKIYHHRIKVGHFGKVKIIKRREKQRKPKGFQTKSQGDLVQLDTVVRFLHGMKRYVITAMDTHSNFGFALSYTRANSRNAKHFFQKLETVFPGDIKHVQTDNGSEFHKYFSSYIEKSKTIHFWNYKGKPYLNGHVERFNRSLQEEFIDWNESFLEDTSVFNQKLTDYMIWYNTERPHWSLRLQSPVDFLINNSLLSKMRWTDTYPLQKSIFSLFLKYRNKNFRNIK